MPQSILVLTQDSKTANAVRDSLSDNGSTPRAHFCQRFADFLAALEVAAPDAAVVDIDGDHRAVLAALEGVINQYGRTRFIVTATQATQELLLAAMQVGARHFVQKAAIGQELLEVVRRLTDTTATLSQLGAIVTVLSAGGGCGATVLAVNLTDEMQTLTESPALVVDLDCAYGAVGGYLGLDADYGVADVLNYRDRIDPTLIQSTSMRFSSRLHALLSPATVNFSRPGAMRYERLADLAAACRQCYQWTVVDAPRVSLDVAAELAAISRVTLIASQLAVKDLKTARAMRRALQDRGADVQNIQHVICRYSRHSRLVSIEEAQGVLEGAPVYVVANDFSAASDAVNYGRLLSRGSPRSKLRRDIQTLATMVLDNTRGAAPKR